VKWAARNIWGKRKNGVLMGSRKRALLPLREETEENHEIVESLRSSREANPKLSGHM